MASSHSFIFMGRKAHLQVLVRCRIKNLQFVSDNVESNTDESIEYAYFPYDGDCYSAFTNITMIERARASCQNKNKEQMGSLRPLLLIIQETELDETPPAERTLRSTSLPQVR